MTNKEALKIASWLVDDELCHERTEYCKKSCIECQHEVVKILLKMAQEAENAPTVDMNTELSVAYLKGRRQGQSEDRPQGEWIISQTMDCHSDIIDIYTCPFCGKREYSAYPYCHCGARLKGGAE